MHVNPWAVEGIVDRLKVLHAAGATFGEIGRELSAEFNVRISRNAAIGKATRLGLVQREPRKGSATPRPRTSFSYLPARRGPKIKAEPFIVRPGEAAKPLHISFGELQHGQCKFPYGDGSAASPFSFCGCPSLPKLSYCSGHYSLTRRAVTPKIEREERARAIA